MQPHLVVGHFHLRPGGVRRVIETALPQVVERGGFSAVTLASGEEVDAAWLGRVAASLGGVPLHVHVHGGMSYWRPDCGADDLAAACTGLLARCGGERAVLWTHNLALGRNAPLAHAWARAASATGAVFLSHHHDFFFDNRWARWPDIVRSGFADLRAAAEALLPAGPRTVHLAINRADHRLLSEGFGGRAAWLPNPVRLSGNAGDGRSARSWLAGRTGHEGPFWLMPCRLLRRKNIAEAVLLARWLRPEVRVVTTGRASSADEEPYRQLLVREAARSGWPLDLSVLEGAADGPEVADLIAGAEAVLFTSMQEGFGLALIEAAVARRPLVARALPNVMPDLLAMGLRGAVTYDDVLIPWELLDAKAEKVRQMKAWVFWIEGLPPEARSLACEPKPLDTGPERAVGFSRLTVAGQMEVLSRPPDDLRAALASANPLMAGWRGLDSCLPPAELEPAAAAMLSPARFAEDFLGAIDRAREAPPPPRGASWRTMAAFLAGRLQGEGLYPALFSTAV